MPKPRPTNSHSPWTPKDDRVLRQLVRAGGSADEIAARLGRTRAAVHCRARIQGLSFRAARRRGLENHFAPWTRKDDEAIRQLMRAGLPPSKIAAKLGRTPAALTSHTSRGGLYLRTPRRGTVPPNHLASWTTREHTTLRRLARSGVPVTQIAARLGRTPSAVTQRAFLEGISLRSGRPGAPEHRAPWTPRDVGALRRLLRADTPVTEVAARLGRTVRAIRKRALVAGISFREVPRRGRAARHYTLWTPKDVRALRRLAREGESVAAIAAELGRSPSTVWWHASRNGISFRAARRRRRG
jgi:hypothetical protein